MTDEELREVIHKLRRLENRKRECATQLDTLRKLIRMEMVARGKEVLNAGKFTVRLVSYERKQFDSKAFAAVEPSLYEAFSKPQTVTRVEVVG